MLYWFPAPRAIHKTRAKHWVRPFAVRVMPTETATRSRCFWYSVRKDDKQHAKKQLSLYVFLMGWGRGGGSYKWQCRLFWHFQSIIQCIQVTWSDFVSQGSNWKMHDINQRIMLDLKHTHTHAHRCMGGLLALLQSNQSESNILRYILFHKTGSALNSLLSLSFFPNTMADAAPHRQESKTSRSACFCIQMSETHSLS